MNLQSMPAERLALIPPLQSLSASKAPENLVSQSTKRTRAQQVTTPRPTACKRPTFGTWLDDDLRLSGPQGDKFLHSVIEKLELAACRKRKRKPIESRDFETLVSCILANCLRTVYFRASDRVAYLRTANAYSNNPNWLNGRALARTVDAMVAADLLSNVRGEWGKSSSTFNMDLQLIDLVVHANIGPMNISQQIAGDRSLVRLRSDKAHGKVSIPFKADVQTTEWCTLLQQFNEFLANHELGINLSHREVASLLSPNQKAIRLPDRQPAVVKPELFKRTLFRTFNNGSFELGGRLYGGWWISSPKLLRQHITIAGNSTVELDYSGLAVRMLYHLEGIDYQSDPYTINELEQYARGQGLSADHYRNSVKQLFQALLNTDSEGGRPQSIELEVSFGAKYRPTQVIELIKAKHSALSKYFKSGVGLKLQRYDSDMALAVITNLRKAGILALPIHDSFIVQKIHEGHLRAEMTNCYQQKFTFLPIIV